MRRPRTYTALEDLGRVRLSRHFAMRNFLYSEIGNFYRVENIPDDPDLAIEAGRLLAKSLLDPLVETFGPIDVRSGFRSARLNHFGATRVKPQKCAANQRDLAGHLWDHRDEQGRMGAMVSVAVPWFSAQYNRGRDWRDMAWWLHDHLPPHYAQFYPRNAAFNIGWRVEQTRRIDSYIAPRGTLLKPGGTPEPGRGARYADFPPFRGIVYPAIPEGENR